MKSYILTVTLNPAIDKTVIVPNFKVGHDFREQALAVSAGGKGINVSRVLKRLGVTSIASGFLGGSNGIYIREQLDKEKINHDFCAAKGNTRVSLTVIDPALNTITRVLERGESVSKKELNAFGRKFFSLLKYCRGVVLSGRNIPGASIPFYSELISAAKNKGIISVFDTSGKAYEAGLKKKPFMIKPNLAESEQVLGQSLSSLSKIKQAAKSFYNRGIKIVAITMGSKGVVAFDGKQMLLASPPKVERKSPVGCGDAFIGGFISSYIGKRSFSNSIKMAVACGAANVLSLNPGFISLPTVKKIFKQINLKEISL
jgi:1-phosphofructokinase family hexose kinase